MRVAILLYFHNLTQIRLVLTLVFTRNDLDVLGVVSSGEVVMLMVNRSLMTSLTLLMLLLLGIQVLKLFIRLTIAGKVGSRIFTLSLRRLCA